MHLQPELANHRDCKLTKIDEAYMIQNELSMIHREIYCQQVEGKTVYIRRQYRYMLSTTT